MPFSNPAIERLARPWRPAPGKTLILLYLILIHLLALLGVALFPRPSLSVLGWALLFACLGGLGTTVGYHRALAHRAVKLWRPLDHLLTFFAMFNGSGSPATWVAYHRHHHAHADTPEDISSPRHGGFWWAHLGWLYQSAPAQVSRWCPELDRGLFRWWGRMEVPVILLSLGCGLFLGWEGFFWIGAIRLVYALHMQCFVNSLAHMGGTDSQDSSRNLWWLGPLQLSAWGENWHRNHHAHGHSARLGFRWWQVDVGWYVICALERLGLARQVRRPPASA